MKPSLAKAIIFLAIALSLAVKAASDPPVTKIVFRYIAADLAGNAAGAQSKTLYIASTRYARIEQETGLSRNEANLIIVNEPNIWIVDRLTLQGTHSVNAGPDLTVHNPILGPDGPEDLFAFEFGHELEFLNRVGAPSIARKTVSGRHCDTREFEAKGYLVSVDIDAKKNTPIELRVHKEGKLKFTIQYSNYDTGLPFDSTLFNPPKHTVLSEAPN
jgi:hypothetical protein